MEEWISLKQYMERYKIGYKVALQMMHNSELEYRKTPGGQYKIKVGGQTVSYEVYEKLVRENEKLRSIIKTMQTISNQVEI